MIWAEQDCVKRIELNWQEKETTKRSIVTEEQKEKVKYLDSSNMKENSSVVSRIIMIRKRRMI